jgi:hypothetical protein
VIKLKTKVLVFALLLVFLLSGSAYAQETRINNAYAGITFSGTVATCFVDIDRDNSYDKISATIKLNCGSQNIKTWNEYSDTGRLKFSDDVDVTKGNTYELVVEYTVNGKAQKSFSGSGTCK